jgi:hypothetical protein
MNIHQKISELTRRLQELQQAYISGIPLSSDPTLKQNHCRLARWCFRFMKEELLFNICGAKTSFLTNADLKQTSQLSSDAISPELAYATKFWAIHLQSSSSNHELLADVNYFISTQFLYWLEVLSFLESVRIASPSLLRAVAWIRVSMHLVTSIYKSGLNI